MPLLPASFTTYATSALSEMSLMLFPRACAGCGTWDTSLCAACQNELTGQWEDVSEKITGLHVVTMVEQQNIRVSHTDTHPQFPVLSLGAYSGVRKKIVVTWKNTIDAQLTARIEESIRTQSRLLAHEFSAAGIKRMSIVPAPSRWQRKHDGLFVTGHYAQWLTEEMNAHGIHAHYRDILQYKGRRVKDTSKQGRKRKAQGITARASAHGEKIVIVDDVVASGATLNGCARALRHAGAHVFCAVVLANSSL